MYRDTDNDNNCNENLANEKNGKLNNFIKKKTVEIFINRKLLIHK